MLRYIFRLTSILSIILCLWSLVAAAQDEATPIDWQASSISFDRQLGEDVRRLKGDVVFTHEDTRMYCDSAYLYSNDNSLRAFSNIKILVSDTVTVYGDELFYDGNKRWAELTGNVLMTDPQMMLYTDYLEYDLDANTANYIDGGRIVDAENELTSLWGFYFADEKEFFFRDDVVLVNPEYLMESDTLMYNTVTEVAWFHGPTTIISEENTIFCRNGWYDTRNDIARFSRDAFFTNREQSMTGDSVFYDRNAGYGMAVNNVLIRDSIENIFITGHFAEHFENEGLSVVTREAVMTMVADNDSLFMHADTLQSVYVEETDQRRLFAYHKARFFRSDLQGLSDSLVYDTADSTIYMFHDPVLWTQTYQLTARNIEVKTTGDAVQSLRLNEAAFIIAEVDTLGFNQMKGRSMTGHFRDNALWRVDVDGNGETIFYLREEDGDLVGINKGISSNIMIYVDGNEITGIQFVRQPESTLYPPNELLPDERLLQNFEWMDHRRPQNKEDIFNWR
jgi:lipopolysaccharide export system protein LptA